MPLTVDFSSSDREELTSWVHSSSVRAGLAHRARIVLLAADGVGGEGDRGAGRGVEADGDCVEESAMPQKGLVAWLIDRSRGGLRRSTRSRWCRRRWSRRLSVWG